MQKANKIIKTNYQRLFHQNFLDLLEVVDLLRKEFEQPEHYSLFLHVDWEKQQPQYYALLSYPDRWVRLTIDAHDGRFLEKDVKDKEIKD